MAELKVFYDPKVPPVVDGVVTFETGATLEQVQHPGIWAYEHHGFGAAAPGALTCLFEDLMLGRPTPPSFVIKEVGDVDTLVAASLFLHRELLVGPQTASFVAQVDLVHRRGFVALAHIPEDVGRFIRLLRGFFLGDLPDSQVNAKLPVAVGWVKDYLEAGRLPSLGAPFPQPHILESRSDGFVVAESGGSLPECWFEVYRQGYLSGVLFGARQGHRLPVLVARKSPYVLLNLNLAATLLNHEEVRAGGTAHWAVADDWLWGPPEGSLLLAADIVRTVASLFPLLTEQ